MSILKCRFSTPTAAFSAFQWSAESPHLHSITSVLSFCRDIATFFGVCFVYTVLRLFTTVRHGNRFFKLSPPTHRAGVLWSSKASAEIAFNSPFPARGLSHNGTQFSFFPLPLADGRNKTPNRTVPKYVYFRPCMMVKILQRNGQFEFSLVDVVFWDSCFLFFCAHPFKIRSQGGKKHIISLANVWFDALKLV